VKTVRWVTCLIGLAVFIGLGNPRACAQAEIDPDHYEPWDPEPPPQSKTNAPGQVSKIHYEGNFVLPYSLQCNRNSLPPGKYSIAVDSEGGMVRVTVSRRGHSMKIEGITKRQRPNHRCSVLVVERSGATRQLSAVQVAQLDLVFSPTLGFENPADSKPRNLQELPLTSADSRR
jgi:hypothetical protein